MRLQKKDGLFSRIRKAVLNDYPELNELQGQVDAINKSMGVIEFNLDGTVIHANPNFLRLLGYELDEIKGQHHRIFVDPAYAASPEYQSFWEKLRRGEYDASEYKRIGKGGREVWIQASYNPIRDQNDQVYKVVKYATDITEEKLRNANYRGQIDAINKSMGVIEFNLDGTVIDANDIFLNLIKYRREEAKGIHHRNFVDAEYAASDQYRQFWEQLGKGQFNAGEYQRKDKNGEDIWIQASYNPISDASGKVYKVVKYASDVTDQKRYQLMVEKVLTETRSVMSSLADGDLTHTMAGNFEGEFAILRDAVNSSIKNLSDIIIQITDSGERINSAAGEIAAGNTDLSSRTEEQASSLEETAASMEELATTVKQNAENTRQADQFIADASGIAAKGNEVINEVVHNMSSINDASRRVADIITVIDGIAFQTNILALNAAVEAARAGEQGRGFSVVAGEVRSLAQRSADAATEIKQLIANSVEKVESGTRLVQQAGETMENIMSAVKRITDIMREVANASEEQSSGIQQVNQAIGQMDSVTQQNAALVEEAAAAAQSLEEQARALAKAVGRFNTGVVTKVIQSESQQPAHSKPVKTNVATPRKPQAVKEAHDDWDEF
ncbi:methyl-accepting chemotaxis protein [Gynuella sp.]|uniref:methyl-accepting chemotaxis protein n=1 Tax=Gynuella sp. TaxID=2969146 RepID=UPI003D101C7C